MIIQDQVKRGNKAEVISEAHFIANIYEAAVRANRDDTSA